MAKCKYCQDPQLLKSGKHCSGCHGNKQIDDFITNTKELKTCNECRNKTKDEVCFTCEKIYIVSKSVKSPIKNCGCTLLTHQKRCTVCNKLKLVSREIEPSRNICRADKNTQIKNCRADKILSDTIICRGPCGLEKTRYEKDRYWCEECRRAQKETLRIKSDKEIIEEHKGSFKYCIGPCGMLKEITTDNFSIHTNNFRNVCIPCISSKKYYIKHRQNKRLENEEQFLAHNARIQNMWRETNMDVYKEWRNSYMKTFGYKISYYKCSKNFNRLSETEITLKFKELMKLPCFYCGFKDENYNGIDRIDSDTEYSLDNIVSCCALCNMSKGVLDIGTFLQKVRQIAINNSVNATDLEEYHFTKDTFLKTNCMSYNSYKSRSIKNFGTFDIVEKCYNSLIKEQCYLCGDLNGKNGLDRVDNKIGYTENNVKSCCCICNVMKKATDLDIFLQLIDSITIHSTSERHMQLAIDSTFRSLNSKTKLKFSLNLRYV